MTLLEGQAGVAGTICGLKSRIKMLEKKLQAQPNALKASEVKPKPLSKQKIEEIVTDWHSDEYGTIESLAEAIYLTQGEEE